MDIQAFTKKYGADFARSVYGESGEMSAGHLARRLDEVVGRRRAVAILTEVGGRSRFRSMFLHLTEVFCQEDPSDFSARAAELIRQGSSVSTDDVKKLIADIKARPSLEDRAEAYEFLVWRESSSSEMAQAMRPEAGAVEKMKAEAEAEMRGEWIARFVLAGLQAAFTSSPRAWEVACAEAEWGGGDVENLVQATAWEWWTSSRV